MAGNAEELGPGIVRPPDGGEPGRAATADVGYLGDRLDIVDRGWAAVKANIGRERRLQSRFAFLSFEAFEERGLLPANVGSGAVVNVKVEIPAVDVVVANELGLISLLDGGLQALALTDELAANIDVGGVSAHGESRDQ